MKNTLYILMLSMLVLPLSAYATTFEAPDRELTLQEKKVGSLYRGCIGFHCLEEEPFLEVHLSVSDAPCTKEDAMSSGVLNRDGYACLSVGTNAREGVIVSMRTEKPTETCLDEASDGFVAIGALVNGCAEIDGNHDVMGSQDQVDGGFGRLKLAGVAGPIKLMSIIAY